MMVTLFFITDIYKIPFTLIAFGNAGHLYSQAPQPIHLSGLTEGYSIEGLLESLTIVIA